MFCRMVVTDKDAVRLIWSHDMVRDQILFQRICDTKVPGCATSERVLEPSSEADQGV